MGKDWDDEEKLIFEKSGYPMIEKPESELSAARHMAKALSLYRDKQRVEQADALERQRLKKIKKYKKFFPELNNEKT